MKAVTYQAYGSPDVLKIEEVDKPAVPDDGVLVRVHATSVNPADWHTMTGTPYVARAAFGLRKPKTNRLGFDFAGTVESVGAGVKELKPGDEVFGGKSGAFAEYVIAAEDDVVLKPASVSFEQAAAVPVAGLTALQGLRDHGQMQPGHRVLINGASGGVGTFAVQVAKALGADSVTGVCSTGNVDQTRSLGADRVIDYTTEDFTRGGEPYDLLLDIAGSRPWSESRRVLKPRGAYVVVGGPKKNPWVGPLSHVVKVRLTSRGASQRLVTFWLAKLTRKDMLVLKELLEAGKLKPVIDRRYNLSEIAEALAYLGEGHAKGKIVVAV